MVFNYRDEKLRNLRVWQPEKELVNHKPPSPSSPVRIHIDFVLQKTRRLENRFYDSNGVPHVETVREYNPEPTEVRYGCISALEFASYTNAKDFITKKLEELGIETRFHHRIFSEILLGGFYSRLGDLASNSGRMIIPLRVQMELVQVYVQDDEEELVQRIIRESILENESRNYGVVPASKSSVGSLKCKILESDGESCRVCLEEFPAGSKVTCMPCSHVFHRNCITAWLGISHFCPICRFNMPTD